MSPPSLLTCKDQVRCWPERRHTPHPRQCLEMPETPWSCLVVFADLQKQTRCGITPEISSQTAALGKIAFKWKLSKLYWCFRFCLGFQKQISQSGFLLPLLKISRKILNSSFARIITREKNIRGCWWLEEEGSEKCPRYPVTWLTLANFCLWPSDIISSFIIATTLCAEIICL